MADRLGMTGEQARAQAMTELARFGWLSYHNRRVRLARADGSTRHATALSGVPGFPDVLFLQGPWLVVVEFKGDREAISPTQQRWLAAWEQVAAANPYVRVQVVRPRDLQGFYETMVQRVRRFP